ncbi:hypothetical protein A9Q81_17155 [Gammaproteobacteria bacterium 42_54_T18]|nr:hypothetical protein A9Q81_17155 [Gammaproteobacteria bacterium 42_54_T18]
MRLFLFVIFVCFSSVGYSVDTLSDFWDKCPGPACPSNKSTPFFIDDAPRVESWDRERIEKEKELLDREKDLFEREIRFYERER